MIQLLGMKMMEQLIQLGFANVDTTTVRGANDVFVADMDGDGDLDIISANS